MTLLLGASLLAVPAVLVPASLRVAGPLAAAVAGLVTASATLVLATEVLSVLHALQTGWMLAFQALAAGGALAGWHTAGRPALLLPPLPRRECLLTAARAHPAAAGMTIVAALALGVQGVMAVLVVPNNWDSMTHHLARIAYWLQLDSALHFDLGTQRQLAPPPNGEFLQAWTLLVSGSDRLAALVQWTAAVGLGAVVALGARALGFGRAPAAFAGSLWIVLPQPILQASTTQNDVIAAFFAAAAALFFVRGLRHRGPGELAVGGMALGLAIGAKGTVLPALPSIGLLALAAVAAYRPPPRLVLGGAAAALAGVIALGSFNYALNVDTFDDPLGGLKAGVDRDSPQGGNAVRIAWTFVDSPGTSIPWLELTAARTVEAVFGDVRNQSLPELTLDTRVHEDLTAYGLFGLLLFLPLLGVELVRRRSPPAHRAVAGAALLFLVLFAATNEYNPWIGRVMLPGLALGAPLLAVLYRPRALRAAAIALALLGLAPALVVNEQKRLLVPEGQQNILDLRRPDQQTVARPDIRAALESLRGRVGAHTPIGLVRVGDSWDYVFFGPNRTRRVVPLRAEDATAATMRSEGLGGIVFTDSLRPRGQPRAERLAPGHWFVPPPG